jgi:hypothetical protein
MKKKVKSLLGEAFGFGVASYSSCLFLSYCATVVDDVKVQRDCPPA